MVEFDEIEKKIIELQNQNLQAIEKVNKISEKIMDIREEYAHVFNRDDLDNTVFENIRNSIADIKKTYLAISYTIQNIYYTLQGLRYSKLEKEEEKAKEEK